MVPACLLLLLLLISHAAVAGEASATTDDDLARAAAQVNAELEAVQAAGGQLDQAATAIQAASSPRAADSLTAGAADIAAMRDSLLKVEGGLGGDVLQQALGASLAHAGAVDPNPEQTYATGPDGSLWIFWAMDQRGAHTELLPKQLSAVQAQWPHLVVHDSHIMKLSDWYRLFHKMGELKDQLEVTDSAQPRDEALARKLAVRDAELPELLAASTMASARRPGGYLLVEDMSAAIAYHVTKLPTFVFTSPRGLVHRISGMTPERGIDSWISQALAWEDANLDALRARGLIP